MAESETYELVPVSPIRRLEKEVQQLKKDRSKGSDNEMVAQVIDILKMNQKIVNDMTKMHGELISQLYKTNEKLSKLSDSVAELVVVLSGAAEEEVVGSGVIAPISRGASRMEDPMEGVAEEGELDNKLERIIEQNTALINSLNVLGKELSKMEEKG